MPQVYAVEAPENKGVSDFFVCYFVFFLCFLPVEIHPIAAAVRALAQGERNSPTSARGCRLEQQRRRQKNGHFAVSVLPHLVLVRTASSRDFRTTTLSALILSRGRKTISGCRLVADLLSMDRLPTEKRSSKLFVRLFSWLKHAAPAGLAEIFDSK